MERGKSLRRGHRVSQGDIKVPLPALLGPLMGLCYVLIIPTFVVGIFIFNAIHWGIHRVAIMLHRAAHTSAG